MLYLIENDGKLAVDQSSRQTAIVDCDHPLTRKVVQNDSTLAVGIADYVRNDTKRVVGRPQCQ